MKVFVEAMTQRTRVRIARTIFKLAKLIDLQFRFGHQNFQLSTALHVSKSIRDGRRNQICKTMKFRWGIHVTDTKYYIGAQQK